MNEYQYTLTFTLPDTQDDPTQYLDALFEAGCDDAVVGTGTPGMISLEFNRNADSAMNAVDSAIRDVMKAIPGASLIEVKPDLVGLTDVAEILDCSRQNIRKYVIGYPNFPRPAVTGKFQLWHLWEIAKFDKFSIPETIIEISKVAWKLNLDLQNRKFKAKNQGVRSLDRSESINPDLKRPSQRVPLRRAIAVTGGLEWQEWQFKKAQKAP